MIFEIDDIVEFRQDDEDQYALVVWSAEHDDLDNPFEMTMPTVVAVSLYQAVRKVMGEYVAEMEEARESYRRWKAAHDEDTGYALDDPKHPTWAEQMAEGADLDRKREKEGGP